jgi:hypothetical protein
VRRGIPGLAGRHAVTLDDRDTAAGAGEDDGRGQPGNPGADDHDIGLQRLAEGREASKLVRDAPERFVADLHDPGP